MAFWFEYIEEQIDTQVLRELTQLDDEALKFTMASWICSITGGMKCSEIPTKAPKVELARRLIKKGRDKKSVIAITGISERNYYYLKKEIENG